MTKIHKCLPLYLRMITFSNPCEIRNCFSQFFKLDFPRKYALWVVPIPQMSHHSTVILFCLMNCANKQDVESSFKIPHYIPPRRVLCNLTCRFKHSQPKWTTIVNN